MKTIDWQGLALEAAEILVRWGLDKITSENDKK